MILRDRVYARYRDITRELQQLTDEGFRKFIQSKRYLKIRKKYLELKADIPNPLLDRRVNELLQIDFNPDRKTWKTKSDPPEKKRKKRRNPNEISVEDKIKSR